jgi:predicted transcriptional regulator
VITLKHVLSKSQSSLEAFQEKARAEHIIKFVKSLTENKLKIIQLLDSGLYQAAIARRLKLSKSYINRFVKELLHKGCISKDFVNPITHVATSYLISPQLKVYIKKLETSKPNFNTTLAIPHNVRYKFPMMGKKVKISLNTKRFAAAKLKMERDWCMRGGTWYNFTMRHEHIGNVGITVTPSSLLVYQKDRSPIIAKSCEDATNIISMSLHEVANRFVQEQAWENVHIELGQPELVGSPHFAFNSKISQKIVAAGNALMQVGNGLEIDDSLKGKFDQAEIETTDATQADLVDKGLRVAADIENIVPAMIQKELRSVSEQVLGINAQAEKIDLIVNSVQALCQSGLPRDPRLEQLFNVVATQGKTINLMQESMLGIIKNMELMLHNQQKGV